MDKLQSRNYSVPLFEKEGPGAMREVKPLLSGAEAILLASAPLSQRFILLGRRVT